MKYNLLMILLITVCSSSFAAGTGGGDLPDPFGPKKPISDCIIFIGAELQGTAGGQKPPEPNPKKLHERDCRQKTTTKQISVETINLKKNKMMMKRTSKGRQYGDG